MYVKANELARETSQNAHPLTMSKDCSRRYDAESWLTPLLGNQGDCSVEAAIERVMYGFSAGDGLPPLVFKSSNNKYQYSIT